MEIDKIDVLDVQQIERGSLFYLGRHGHPALCLRGFKKEHDGSESERVIPIQFEDEPRSERRAIHASRLRGVGMLVHDSHVVPDLSSATHTSATGYAEASLYIFDGSAFLPLQGDDWDDPVVNLKTGEVLNGLPRDRPWVGLNTWRIEAGPDRSRTIFEQHAMAKGGNDE